MKSNKPWHKKIKTWIGIVASIFTILGITLFGNKSIFNNHSVKDDPVSINNYEVETGNQSPIAIDGGVVNVTYYNNTSFESTEFSKTNISKNDTLTAKATSQFDFAEAIRHIHSNELIIKEKAINNDENKPVYSSIYPGVSYTQISNDIRLIEITNGYREYQCSRLYHFDEEGKLTFSLIKDNSGEHRLYFYNDTLIRYIDTDDNVHDINYGLENFECKWTELALTESYEIFSGVKSSSSTDELSVTASFDMNTPQTSVEGVNVLIEAETSFPADHVTISGISDNAKLDPCDMHGGEYKWQFVATFYIKGNYTVTITAYNSEGVCVSDKFTYVY